MRKLVVKIHLWLGIAAGLVLSVVGITGSIYVFEPELSRVFSNNIYKASGDSSLFKKDADIALLIENQTNQKIESLQWPQRGRDIFMYKLFHDKRWYYLDQTTGKLLNEKELLVKKVFNFILDLHMSLTLGDAGYYVTATASLIFAVFMLTTGIYLWWPSNKGRRKSSFKIKVKAKPKRFNYDLHNVTGFYFFLPLFLMGITGAYFTYDKEIQWVVDKITFSEPAPELIWEAVSEKKDTTAAMFTVVEALEEMNKFYPGYFKRNLWMTDQANGTLSFAYQKYSHVHAGADTRIFLKVDPYTGEVMDEYNPEKLPRGAALTARWLLPIHMGEFGGLFTRILWFFAGFIPALLTWTGIKIWWGKKYKKKKVLKLAMSEG